MARSDNRWLVTLAVTVGTLMGAIVASIVNVALPHMQAMLGVTIDQITWVSTAYMISVVIIMPLTAWLGSLFGRKRVYMSCLVLFVVASFFCGNAHTFLELIVFRAIQGLGAGALQPTEQAILRETFPLEEQGLAMALYGVAVMIGPAVGPTLGGWITDNYSWRWIFFINLPIGVIGTFMVWSFVHDPPYLKNRKPLAIDYIGIGLLTVGLATLQTMLEQGERLDWFNSSVIAGLAFIAAACLCTFVYWELKTDHPAVDLRLLKNLSFTAGTIVGGVLGVSLFSAMFLLPLFMQTLMGYTPMQSGMAMIPRAVTMMVCMPIAGSLFNFLGARKMVTAGLFIAGSAAWMMSRFTEQTSFVQLVTPQIIQGVGFALIFVSLSTASLATVPREKMTNATGLYNLIRQLGGSFGIAIFATLLEKHMASAHAVLAQNVNPYNPAFQQRFTALQHFFMGLGADANTARLRAYAVIDGILQRQAAVLSYEHLFQLSAALILLCLPMVFTLRDRVVRGQKVEMHGME